MNINAADTSVDEQKIKMSSGKTSKILFREQWKITNWNVLFGFPLQISVFRVCYARGIE